MPSPCIPRLITTSGPIVGSRVIPFRKPDVGEASGSIEMPWRHAWLCINPFYPLPEAEFFAHLYLYVRDQEEEIVRVAAPQPWDQALGRTF